MSEPPRGVPAAPNRSTVEAKVLDLRQSERFRDRWDVEVEILSSRAVEGPNFAHPGARVRAFAFGEHLDLEPGSTITAQAEYVGDERGGAFRLSELAPSRD